MSDPITVALKILSHFWLEEVQESDDEIIVALPELAQAFSPGPNRDDLAVEYQRLFGFNLPPYESVFVDPSAMLMAPATGRVQTLYQQVGWTPPAGIRAGAPDHLGLQLLALADWMEQRQTWATNRLLTRHLALWVPAFIFALQRLAPPPFYATLAELTLELILSTLPAQAVPGGDPFPNLPPPPIFRASGPDEFAPPSPPNSAPAEPELSSQELRLRDVVKKLLPPCEVGLHITRQDIVRISQTLDLPVTMGDRFKMLESLFRQAGEFDLVPDMLAQLNQLFQRADQAYQSWANDFPAWGNYAEAWQLRLNTGKALLHDLAQTLSKEQAR